MAYFVLLLVQGVAFYALTTSSPLLFYGVLAGLLAFDILWVWLTTRYSSAEATDYRRWMAVNAVAVILLTPIAWLDAGWSTAGCRLLPVTRALGRTVADYTTSWGFYYPEPDRLAEPPLLADRTLVDLPPVP